MDNTPATRRGFLNLLTNLVVAALGLLILIPALVYVLAPLWRRQGGGGPDSSFVDAGPIADIPIGEWRLLSFVIIHEDEWRKTRTPQAVWVRRQGPGDQQITVLSSTCPHLGCPINWHPQQRQFVCPCHKGVFDQTGEKIGGPPPRDMDPLQFEVRSGKLWVRWQDFRIGVRERIAVNI